MNITYVVTKKVNENFVEETIESVKVNLKNQDRILLTTIDDEQQLYYKIRQESPDIFEACDYVVIIPNNSFLEPKFRDIVDEYVDNNKTIYLPFVLLMAEDNTKGLLNTSMWSSHSIEVGKLDHELSLLQSDSILFGAIIPKEILFNEDNYNKELKYFQHFYFINSITANEDLKVIGIPKLLANLNYDLTYNYVIKEEKIANYKLAREKFTKKLAEVNG